MVYLGQGELADFPNDLAEDELPAQLIVKRRSNRAMSSLYIMSSDIGSDAKKAHTLASWLPRGTIAGVGGRKVPCSRDRDGIIGGGVKGQDFCCLRLSMSRYWRSATPVTFRHAAACSTANGRNPS